VGSFFSFFPFSSRFLLAGNLRKNSKRVWTDHCSDASQRSLVFFFFSSSFTQVSFSKQLRHHSDGSHPPAEDDADADAATAPAPVRTVDGGGERKDMAYIKKKAYVPLTLPAYPFLLLFFLRA
jgi:hypothetical protein